MKTLLSVFVLLLSFSTYATPGDLLCTGTNNGEAVEMLIGYDAHQQTAPSLLQVTVKNTVVFESYNVNLSMLNVGTDEMPFINTVWTASDEESSLLVRLPEQDPDADFLVVYITVATDSGLFKATEVEMTCPY